MTPTLSVAAVQLSEACPAPPVALRVGVVGGLVSGIRAEASFESPETLPARILGGQLVVVAAGREPEVGVERRHRLGDPVGKRGRKARARAPVEVVARDAHVVGRSAPGDVDVCPDNRGCHPGGRSRGARVGNACRDLVRGAGEVAGRVLGGHLVVVGADRKPAVAIARPDRLGDPVAERGGKACACPPVEVVAGNRDVVCRASQERLTVPPATEAVRLEGAVGGVVSASTVAEASLRPGRCCPRHPLLPPCSSRCRARSYRCSSSLRAGRSGWQQRA